MADDYHGTKVSDPYRWLEDLNSDETRGWVNDQNAFSERFLAAIPERDKLRKRLTELWNYPRSSVPHRLTNNVLFYLHNSGLQKQSVVMARSSPQTKPKVILDPNAMWPDGNVSLSQFEPSPDGRYVAWAASTGGADWQEVRVRRVRDGKDLAESLKWVRFSGLSWTRDGKGFFYSRYPAGDEGTRLSDVLEHHRIYYHRVGTAQESDVLVYERNDLPAAFLYASTSEDGRYLFISLYPSASSRNRLYVMDLMDPQAPRVSGRITPIIDNDDAEFDVLGNVRTTVFVRTNLEAPKRRIVAIDLQHPERSQWKTIVAEGESTIGEAAITRSTIVVNRLVDVTSELSIYSLAGKRTGTVKLPAPGTATMLSTTTDASSFYFAFTSHLYPTTVFRYNAATRRIEPFEKRKIPFDQSRFETKRVFAISGDGTRIPLFLSHLKGLKHDGTHPALLYAYGGFSVDLTPSFSPAAIAWMEEGGVYATASLRGGGEYGEAWHRAGMREHKQNVFDDFIASAEYLVREKYTEPSKLVINGASNGGLLVGAVMTQRPDLFGVAIPQVGVMDMLRYHRFTGGAAWADEYGSADDPSAFKTLVSYSPLHRIKSGVCYPATLVTTADHDDRVVPSHSYKFAAALQHAQECSNPILIRVEKSGSHGYRPTDRLISEVADMWGFALNHVRNREP